MSETLERPTPTDSTDPTYQRLPEGYVSRARQRLHKAYACLVRDRLKETYEAEPIRRIEHQLELLESGAYSDSSPEARRSRQQREDELENRLAELRVSQDPSPASDNPRVDLVFVKPGLAVRQQLEVLERDALVDEIDRVRRVEGPAILEGVRRSARTAVMMRSGYEDESSVRQAIREVLVGHLMRLELQTEEYVTVIKDTDPELRLTEDEEESLRVSDALEGGEATQAMMDQHRRREDLIETKRQALIRNRLEEVEQHRKQLMALPEETLVERAAAVEMMTLAAMRSRKAAERNWLLFCVLDAEKPIYGTTHGQTFVKAYHPYFGSLKEVKDAEEGMDDFYRWCVEQKERLDYLTEEDLLALAEYQPFRGIVQSMLGIRRSADPVAHVLGTGSF